MKKHVAKKSLVKINKPVLAWVFIGVTIFLAMPFVAPQSGVVETPLTFYADAAEEFTCPLEGKEGIGLVPCGRKCDDPSTKLIDESQDCNFCHFFYLFEVILNWIVLKIAPLVASFVIIFGGVFFIISRGNPGQTSKARNAVIVALGGYALMFVAWIVINSIFAGIGVAEWTGFTPQTKNGKITSSSDKDPELYLDTLFVDIAVDNDQFNGLFIKTTSGGAAGESRKIVKTTWPSTIVTEDWGLTMPKSNDQFEIKVGGWWQFSCGLAKNIDVDEDADPMLFRDEVEDQLAASVVEWDFNGDIPGENNGVKKAESQGIEGTDAIRLAGDDYTVVTFTGAQLTALNSITTDITVTAWIKPEKAPERRQTIVARWGNETPKKSFMLHTFVDGNAEFTITDGAGKYFEARSALNTVKADKWHYLVGVFKGSEKTIKLYVNSKLNAWEAPTGIFAGLLPKDGNSMFIGGGLKDAGLVGFNGLIDDIKIYNGAYSP